MEGTDQERSRYFQSIARYFFKQRGAPFFLSSRELGCISGWETKEIPLPVVLEGIKIFFDNARKKTERKVKIKSLVFCDYHVLRAFEQYRDKKVGYKKRVKEREEKTEKAKAEVRRFQKTIPSQIRYLREAYSRAQEVLSQSHLDEEELEQIEDEIEELLWENSPDEEKNRIRREVIEEYKSQKEEEFLRIFKIKLVKFLRAKYKIPHISLFYY